MTSIIYRDNKLPLEGSQVVNLLHSGYNITSNNSTTGQNLTVSKNIEPIQEKNIIPNYQNISNELSKPKNQLLLLVGGIVLAVIILK